MAKKNQDMLGQLTEAGSASIDLINRLDEATGKFQPGKRKGSIIKAAQGNVFEFPVFISNSIPIDYATATTSLIEQLYASFLQMAISMNPVIDADSVKNGLQFANLMTNTNKYLEYTEMDYAHDACHAVYQESGYNFEFNMLSIEDSDARRINERLNHQPLSEFSHFFVEAKHPYDYYASKIPVPEIDPQTNEITGKIAKDSGGKLQYMSAGDLNNYLSGVNYTDRNGNTSDAFSYWMSYVNANENLIGKSSYDIDKMDTSISSSNAKERTDSTSADINERRRDTDYEDFNGSTYEDHVKNQRRKAKADADKAEKDISKVGDTTYEDEIEARRIKNTADAYKSMQDISKSPNGMTRTGDIENQRRKNAASADIEERRRDVDYGDTPSATYADYIDAQRRSALARADVDARNAAKANSKYYNTLDAIDTTAKAAGSVAGAVNTTANAIYNVGSLGTRLKNDKLNNEILKDRVNNLDADRALKRTEVNTKLAAKAPVYIDDSKCAKLNTMKPLLMGVTINMLNKDDSLQPINYIVGVKTHMRVVPASILPEVAKYPLKEMDKMSRKIKWRAGELKFFKDLIFRINERKQTAVDSRDPRRKWYRRLYELAHMKGDAPAAAVVQGKSLFAAFIRDKQGKSKMMNGVIPNASIIMSQSDVDNIKNQTDIDLLKGSTAKNFCGELFLISLVIIDTDAESIKVMLPDMNNDFEVHSLASVNKQLATLDTVGSKTRDMFKMLG